MRNLGKCRDVNEEKLETPEYSLTLTRWHRRAMEEGALALEMI